MRTRPGRPCVLEEVMDDLTYVDPHRMWEYSGTRPFGKGATATEYRGNVTIEGGGAGVLVAREHVSSRGSKSHEAMLYVLHPCPRYEGDQCYCEARTRELAREMFQMADRSVRGGFNG